MTNTFERLGLIYTPTGAPWHRSHCQNPFVQRLSKSRFRIHFAARDDKNRSRGGWAELEAAQGRLSVVSAASAPSLDLGRLGAFDDCGAMPGSLVEHRGRLLMYYTGWTLARAVPFFFFVGVAESRDGGATFRRLSEAPVLGRNHHDPFLTGAPWVISESGRLRMWYISGTEWVPGAKEGDAPTHYYSIKHATSDDGLLWQTSDTLCLPYLDGEHAIARPVVTLADGGYRMIYAARRLGETYRVYGATSRDGLAWERTGMLLDVAQSGWDSEMVCYGSRLDCSEGCFLLYNGNAYGKDGFGAVRAHASRSG